MDMKRSAVFGLFLGSYAPLFMLLLLTQLGNKVLGKFEVHRLTINTLPLVLAVLCIAGAVYVLSFIKAANSIAPTLIHIKAVERSTQDTLAYLITYLIPFVGFSFVSINYLFANALILIFIGVLYVQSNMVYLNPTMSLFGYRVYKIEVKDTNLLMLAKTHLKPQTTIKASSLNRGFLIESRKQ
jgi:hypothetical protein